MPNEHNWVRLLICLTILSIFMTMGCARQRQPQKVETPAQPAPTVDQAIAAPSPITNKPYPGVGIVKLINRKEGWIEINHEPIPDLVPAMEMEWSVQKRSLLDHVSVGDKVNFTIVDTGKAQIITELKRMNEQKK